MISDLRHLRSFVAATEHRSVSRAAASLSYSQPAVSLHLRALERDVGRVLLDRVATGVRLTEDGVRLLPIAREILRLCALADAPPEEPQPAPRIRSSATDCR